MKKLREKLRARRGMTLSEMLVAVLILGLVTVGVSAGVSASLRVYRESTALADAQTLSSTLSIALMDEMRYAQGVQGLHNDGGHSGIEYTTFTSATFGPNVQVGLDGNGHVTVGGKELIGSGAYAGLEVGDIHVDYGVDGCFHVQLQINRADGGGKYTHEFSVRPLNG